MINDNDIDFINDVLGETKVGRFKWKRILKNDWREEFITNIENGAIRLEKIVFHMYDEPTYAYFLKGRKGKRSHSVYLEDTTCNNRYRPKKEQVAIRLLRELSSLVNPDTPPNTVEKKGILKTILQHLIKPINKG